MRKVIGIYIIFFFFQLKSAEAHNSAVQGPVSTFQRNVWTRSKNKETRQSRNESAIHRRNSAKEEYGYAQEEQPGLLISPPAFRLKKNKLHVRKNRRRLKSHQQKHIESGATRLTKKSLVPLYPQQYLGQTNYNNGKYYTNNQRYIVPQQQTHGMIDTSKRSLLQSSAPRYYWHVSNPTTVQGLQQYRTWYQPSMVTPAQQTKYATNTQYVNQVNARNKMPTDDYYYATSPRYLNLDPRHDIPVSPRAVTEESSSTKKRTRINTPVKYVSSNVPMAHKFDTFVVGNKKTIFVPSSRVGRIEYHITDSDGISKKDVKMRPFKYKAAVGPALSKIPYLVQKKNTTVKASAAKLTGTTNTTNSNNAGKIRDLAKTLQTLNPGYHKSVKESANVNLTLSGSSKNHIVNKVRKNNEDGKKKVSYFTFEISDEDEDDADNKVASGTKNFSLLVQHKLNNRKTVNHTSVNHPLKALASSQKVKTTDVKNLTSTHPVIVKADNRPTSKLRQNGLLLTPSRKVLKTNLKKPQHTLNEYILAANHSLRHSQVKTFHRGNTSLPPGNPVPNSDLIAHAIPPTKLITNIVKQSTAARKSEKNKPHIAHMIKQAEASLGASREVADHAYSEKLQVPKEIKNAYTDRMDESSLEDNPKSHKISSTGPYSSHDTRSGATGPYSSHDTRSGDWFDSGFKPDVETKHDIAMTKASLLKHLKLKKKTALQKPNYAEDFSERKQAIGDKIKQIVKNAEFTESAEIKNLIKNSFGTADEQVTGNLNLGKMFRNVSDQALQDEDPESLGGLMRAAAGDGSSETAKIMAEYSQEIGLDKQADGQLRGEKSEFINQLNARDEEEIRALKSGLKDHDGRNKNLAEGLETPNEKKRYNTQAEDESKLGYTDVPTLNPSSEKSDMFDSNSESAGETSDAIFPETGESNEDKNEETKSFAKIREQWQKVKEQNRKIKESEAEELSEKHHDEENEGDHGHDILNSYFDEVEQKRTSSQNKNLRQIHRQKKIKQTMAMISDIERQIDGMVHDSLSHHSRVGKKRGKAAIFKELVNSHSDDGSEKDDNVAFQRHIYRKSKPRKVLKTAPASHFTAVDKHMINKKKEEELEDNDDESEAADENSSFAKHPDYDDMMNEDYVGGEEFTMSKQKHKTSHRSQMHTQDDTQALHDGTIAKAIALNDQKVRQQQANILLNLQKQEDNDDLMRLKEVSQNGLQTMFAKAVAKQRKFMDDVQNSPPELNVRDQSLVNRLSSVEQPNDPDELTLADQNNDRGVPVMSHDVLPNNPGENYNTEFANEEENGGRRSFLGRGDFDHDNRDSENSGPPEEDEFFDREDK